MSAAVVPVAIGGGVVSVHVARPRVRTVVEVAPAANGANRVRVDEVGVVRHKTGGTAYHKPAQEKPAQKGYHTSFHIDEIVIK